MFGTGRLIIIDHSLVDLQGHYYECSMALAEAAQRAGYAVTLVTHRAFTGPVPSGLTVLPRFEVDWFDQPLLSQNNDPISPTETTAIPSVPVSKPSGFQPLIGRLNTSARGRLLLEKIAGSTQRLNHWFKEDLRRLGQLPFAHTLWGLLKIVWGVIRFLAQGVYRPETPPPSVPPIQSVVPAPTPFITTLQNVLEELAVTPGDRLLIHTIGVAQLQGLVDYARTQPRTQLPQFHLLLRRNVADPLVNPTTGLTLQDCLQGIYHQGLWPDIFQFYTDTEDLIKGHEGLSPIRLQQVPIPFRQEKLTPYLPEPENSPTFTPHKPLKVVYLGDARTEKGYQYLPAVAEALWDEYLDPGKVQLIFQSHYTANGLEGEIIVARQALRVYGDRRVQLLESPLSPEEYYALLAQADLILLPYDRYQYQRTSGVLTEALAAGKPVVVAAGSWLAQQVTPDRAVIYDRPQDLPQAVIQAIAQLESLTFAARQFAPQWREQQHPQHFIQAIAQAPPPALTSLNPGLLYVVPVAVITAPPAQETAFWELVRGWLAQRYRLYGVIDAHSGLSAIERQQVEERLASLGLTRYWILDPLPEDLDPHGELILREKLKQSILPPTLAQLGAIGLIQGVWLHQPEYDVWLDSWGLTDLPRAVYLTQAPADFSPATVFVTSTPPLARTVQEKLPGQAVLSLTSRLQSQGISRHQQRTDRRIQREKITQAWLGEKALPDRRSNRPLRVAVGYPWGEIRERRSGASQRIGYVLDCFRKAGMDLWVLSIGPTEKVWKNGIYYQSFSPDFPQEQLIQQAYRQAFMTWQQITSPTDCAPLTPQDWEETWLPWIYYSLRHDPVFYDQLDRMTDWADVLLLEYPFWGAIAGPLCRQKGVKLIITPYDVLTQQLPQNTLLAKLALGEEVRALEQADQVVTLTPEDQQFFQHHGIQSACIPIGLDIPALQQGRTFGETVDLNTALPWVKRDWTKPFCLFVGSLHPPNQQAVNRLKTFVQESGGLWEVIAVGSCCPPEQTGGFYALGKVDQEILHALYAQATVVVIPLEAGTGMSIKTLEAMAYGKVILGTAIAFRGYPITSGIQGLIHDHLDQYPDKITHIIQHPEDYLAIGENARIFAQKYDYRPLYKKYFEFMETVATKE